MGKVTLDTKTCYVCGQTVDHKQGQLPYEGEERDLCEKHWLAAYYLAMTSEEPPFVEVGLYSEATFYGRQLAAATLDKEVETVVKQSETDNGD